MRAAVRDDEPQAVLADAVLLDSSAVVIPTQSFCEFVWVLHRVYRLDRRFIGTAIRALVGVRTAVVDRRAVEAGLAVLDGGGDFADGVIAYQGRLLGGEVFVSFDRKAVKVLLSQGRAARLLE